MENKPGDIGRLPVRVMLLDGHWITLTAMRMALKSVDDMEIVAEAADYDEAVAVMCTAVEAPDVLVLTDAHDPAVVVSRVGEALPQWLVRVLVIGGDRPPDSLDLRWAAGGWLPRHASEQQFVSAVRLIAAGFCVLPPPPREATDEGAADSLVGAGGHALTVRERDVLLLVAKGYTNAEISAVLRLGESTVKSHVQNLLNKLGARNRVNAAIYAYEVGLVRLGERDRFHVSRN